VDINAIAEAILANDRLGKPREALRYVQGLALVLSDSGKNEEAFAVYCDALERAKLIGDPALLSQVRRNFGLLLADLKHDQQAEVELTGAVEDGKNSSSAEMLGRAQLTLGVFYQHRKRLAEAGPLLVEDCRRSTRLTPMP